jgi:hypothetical protein
MQEGDVVIGEERGDVIGLGRHGEDRRADVADRDRPSLDDVAAFGEVN